MLSSLFLLGCFCNKITYKDFVIKQETEGADKGKYKVCVKVNANGKEEEKCTAEFVTDLKDVLKDLFDESGTFKADKLKDNK